MEFGLVALWLLMYLAFLYAGATLAGLVFPRFADRGVGVGLPLALGVVWLVTYLVGHLSLAVAIWLGVAMLVALVAYAGYRGATVDRGLYLEFAAVFAVAFLLLVAIRSTDPAIRPIGGEKFLDFGLLKSLVRADSLPPEDMWFAGEPVAYYYGGHLVAAILTRITGTAGQYAYNLALAGFYAMLVTAVYGLAGSIAADRGISRRVAGASGAFFVGIASNLSTPGKFLLWLLPEGIAGWLSDYVGLPIEGLAVGPTEFGYWDASRVITDDAADFVLFDPNAAFVINEFPFFAWLNGDMHAHMMSTAFLLLGVAVLFSYYQTPVDERRRRWLLLFGVLPPLAGLVSVVNTWSFPTVGGLTLLTVALAPADPRSLLPSVALPTGGDRSLADEAVRIAAGLVVAITVLAIGFLWSLPFWLGAASGREIAFLPDRTSMGELLLVHGVFVAVFVPYFYLRAADAVDRDAARIAGLVAFAVASLAATVDLAALGLFLPLIFGGWVLRRRPFYVERFRASPARSDGGERESSDRSDGTRGSSAGDASGIGFEGILVVAGAGLVTLVEFVFVAENIGRMNTVFKTYMQVWVLWAVAGGVAFAFVADSWPSRVPTGWKPAAARTFAALLIVSTSLYAGFALSDHFGSDSAYARTDDPTLDGRAWLNVSHTDEGQAIRWMDANVAGRPTIVTAAPGGYTWNPSEGKGSSAPASLTGIPTVLGWHHEAQYRNETVYRDRLGDVFTIYTGERGDRVALLDEYDVQYVYVGPAERNRYDEITIEQVQGVTEVRRWGDVTLYRVHHEQLPE